MGARRFQEGHSTEVTQFGDKVWGRPGTTWEHPHAAEGSRGYGMSWPLSPHVQDTGHRPLMVAMGRRQLGWGISLL